MITEVKTAQSATSMLQHADVARCFRSLQSAARASGYIAEHVFSAPGVPADANTSGDLQVPDLAVDHRAQHMHLVINRDPATVVYNWDANQAGGGHELLARQTLDPDEDSDEDEDNDEDMPELE